MVRSRSLNGSTGRSRVRTAAGSAAEVDPALQPLDERFDRMFAHSLRLAFPTSTAPASRNLLATKLSAGEIEQLADVVAENVEYHQIGQWKAGHCA